MTLCEKCKKEIKEEKKEEITKELVIKRLNEGHYKFSAEETNLEFRSDLIKIDYNLSGQT